MRQQRPSARAERASGASARCLLFLCAAGLLLSSCGDFTLFPEGFGPGPTPDPGDSACARPFLGLDSYQGSPETLLGETIERAAAVAVVPGGMRFEFNPKGTNREATARPGDVLVADLQADGNEIYIYLFDDRGTLSSREVFPAEAETLGGGLALYHEEVEDVDGTKRKVQLLLYTGTSDTGVSNLFLQHLSESSVPSTVLKIPEGTPELPGQTAFQGAGAVAVGRDDTRRGVFVADARAPGEGGHSVYRISLQIPVQTGNPIPDGMTRLAYGFNEIRDIGFSNQTGAFYLTEVVRSITDLSTVHRVTNALRSTSSVTKSAQTLLVQSSKLQASTGLALVPTNNTATTEALLVLNQQRDKALQQFPILDGTTFRTLQLPMHRGGVVRQDVAYDCETARLFITQSKPTGTSTYNRFGLHALTPTD